MKPRCWMTMTGVSLLTLAGLLAAGCGKEATTGPSGAQPTTPAAATDDHSGWWCMEHRVPEEICAQCDPKLAAEYQKQGDWCREHRRPESQCFICSPQRAERFAAEYEAKFGDKPPTPEGKSS